MQLCYHSNSSVTNVFSLNNYFLSYIAFIFRNLYLDYCSFFVDNDVFLSYALSKEKNSHSRFQFNSYIVNNMWYSVNSSTCWIKVNYVFKLLMDMYKSWCTWKVIEPRQLTPVYCNWHQLHQFDLLLSNFCDFWFIGMTLFNDLNNLIWRHFSHFSEFICLHIFDISMDK